MRPWKATAKLKIDDIEHKVFFSFDVVALPSRTCATCRQPLSCEICGKSKPENPDRKDFAIQSMALATIESIEPAAEEWKIRAALLRHSKFTTRFCTDCFNAASLPNSKFWGVSDGVDIT